MKIKNLKIEGYKNLNIELVHNSDIIALIGNNGSGKSNLLEALSLIFRSLYKKSDPTTFDYTIEYIINGITNVNINKQKSKIVFKVNGVQAVSIDEYLPKKVIAIYSGEEQRLWNKVYFPIYDDFIKGINLSKQSGLLSNKGLMPQMLYLNKYYWHICLLTLLISDLEDNKKFVKDVLKINSVEKIKFDFNKSNYKNYSNSLVMQFVNVIDQKTEYTLDEFKTLIDLIYSESDVFNYLYVANSPKGTKIIDDITILYNEHLTIEDFSEGEKKLLLIRAAFEFAEQEDSLFILDEPDAHIHLNNKDQIIKTFEPYKDKRQIVITTHSPTVTQSIDDDNCLFMVNSGKIIERKKQEILSDLTSEFWNKHQQSSFLSSKKDLILLVEGKHDKLHISNAIEKLKEDYPTLDFDIFSMGGEGKIHPFMMGLYEANVYNNTKYIGIYDNDGAGNNTMNKAGFEPEANNCGYRKLKKDKTEHNNFFSLLLPKPADFSKDCTIENLFECEKYEEAYKEALDKSLGNFKNKSIEDINDGIKETSKNILAENSKSFIKSDFVNFKKLFDVIININNLPNVNNSQLVSVNKTIIQVNNSENKKNITTNSDENEITTEKIVSKINSENIKKLISTKHKRSGVKVSVTEHLKSKPAEVKNIYNILKNEIIKYDEFVIDSKVEYIAFKRNKKNLFDIKLQSNKVVMWVNKKKGELPILLSGIFEDCSNKGHHGNGDYVKHFQTVAEANAFVLYGAIKRIIEL